MPDMTASNGELNPMERRDMDDEINLFGMSVKTDESLLDDAVKFVHPDGREDVFIGSEKVIDVELTAQREKIKDANP
jgi:hypothetical protein